MTLLGEQIMISFKDFDESKMVDYTLDELKGFVNEINLMVSVIQEKRAEEMAVYLKDDTFDFFSNRGSKKIKKIADKYSSQIIGANEFLRIIGEEIRKREQYEEEMRYSGKSIKKPKQVSEEEFLKKEEDKTWAYRSKIE